MVTRKDVAEYAGVSTATVSYVVSNKRPDSEDLKKRVEAAIKILEYHPNMYAQSLASKSSRTIALLIDEVTNSYFMEITELIDKYAREKGFFTAVHTTHGNNPELIDELIRRRVDGIINLTLYGLTPKQIQMLKKSNIKITNSFEHQGCTAIIADYISSFKNYMIWLSERNYKRLAFIASFGFEIGKTDLRLKAYLENREALGFDVDDTLIVYGDYPYSKSYENGYNGIKYLVDNSITFDSVFCMNDYTALGSMRSLSDFGIKVPDDVSLLACDNINISEYLYPRLSTIDVSREEMCKIYVDDMVSRINNGDNESSNVYIMETKLIYRETTIS